MNQKKPYSNNLGGGSRPAKKPQRSRVTVEEGQVSFRLLCPVSIVGGLIGHSGTIVKNLEIQTSAKIIIEDSLAADSAERLIYVVGSHIVDKTVTLRNVPQLDVVFDVSMVQEALLRVYERILEVETSATKADGDANAGVQGSGSDGVVRCCRLLAVTDQIGALMGRQGKRIDKIRKESGAYIRVLTLDQLPPLANPTDELIQITGDSIAVRKALVAVSKCLQEHPPLPKEKNVFKHPPMQSFPPSVSHPSFADGDSYSNNGGFRTVEVVYKMLCSSDTAGSIIGKGGSVIKALQEETGASISFSAPLPGCNDRIITVSAMENAESPQSPAQNAVLRAFARANKALTKNGLVTARLVITLKQAGSLIGVRGRIISDLQKVTGTKIQVFEGNLVPHCVTSDERVAQIGGQYANVYHALVEITRKLRERMFSSKGINVIQTRSCAPYPPNRVKDGGISNFIRAPNIASSRNGAHTLQHKLEDLNLNQDNFTGLPSNMTSVGREKLSSEENTTVEVVVPENIFSSVFDDEGEKLARLKEISGAQIEVQHPSVGNDGKVIITGTPDQTFSARCILQLYMVSAK